jgi:putative Mg2+ transporter-C (MgtC) family protein
MPTWPCGVRHASQPEYDIGVNSELNDFTRLTPDIHQLVRITLRLLVAVGIGTVIGLQREITHKPAGLRTHMLVGLGTALLLVSASEAGMGASELSRIIQGMIAGIGFLGGGAILKLTAEREIHGLTTAAGVWMTAAASAAAGLGQITVALLGTSFALLILIFFHGLEKRLSHYVHPHSEAPPSNSKDAE